MLLTRSFKCKTKANLDLISRVPVSVPALFSPRFFPGLFPETGLGYVRTCLCILIRDLSRYNLLFIIICFFFFVCLFTYLVIDYCNCSSFDFTPCSQMRTPSFQRRSILPKFLSPSYHSRHTPVHSKAVRSVSLGYHTGQ